MGSCTTTGDGCTGVSGGGGGGGGGPMTLLLPGGTGDDDDDVSLKDGPGLVDEDTIEEVLFPP